MLTRRAALLVSCLTVLSFACDEDEPPEDAAVDASADADVDAGPPPPTFEPAAYALTGEVDVYRDSLGVAHIYGDNDADVFYASGYMQAVDRLFSMDLQRRRALGRRAEVLGAGFVDDDQLVRTVGVERWGRASAALAREQSPEDFELVVAWTAGVNRRIQEILDGDVPLPYGYRESELDFAPEPWAVPDTFVVGKLILFGNANQLEFDLLATILRDYVAEAFEIVPVMAPLTDAFVLPPEERPAGAADRSWRAPGPRHQHLLPADAEERMRGIFDIVPSPVAQFASNNWALEGRHTESGRPLIAGDPHQGLRSPGVFWMQHLNSADAGGTLDVTGFSFVGTPAVQLGHNARLAWTATTTYPDISDLWEVSVTSTSVSLGGEDLDLFSHDEVIEVRDADPVTITVAEVPGRGVLLPEGIAPLPVTAGGRRLLYNWVGMRATTEAGDFLAIDRASTLEEFEAAVDRMEIGCFNFLAATSDGITYRSSPFVPDRGPGALSRAHWALLDGDDAASLWSGERIPLSDMPRSRGGERGWITSANNDPFGFTGDGTTVGDPFYFGVFYDPGTRAARIESELTRLTERGDVTMADMQALQMDAYTVIADALVPVLEEAASNVATDEALADFRNRPELDGLVAQLSAWDRQLTRDSSAAVVFDAFMFLVTRSALRDDFTVAFEAILTGQPVFMIKWAVLALTGGFERADEVLQDGRDFTVMRALSNTAEFLTERFGGVEPENYTWGEHHGTLFAAEWPGGESGGWFPTDGGVGTVNVSSASFLGAGSAPVERLESRGGAVYRMVAGFNEAGRPVAEVNTARGNSGDPESAFFDNAMSDWIEGNYVPMLFERSEIEADAAESLTFAP
ncbi:MAG: penicillin acylase family protein [Sandaracinaceae bacterium]